MPYSELHCHSNFSLLDGASHPEELVIRAAELGLPALALTDHDAVYGAPRFIRAAGEYGLKPILGAELTLSGGHHLTLLVENEAGWHNLCYLISRARHNRAKGFHFITLEDEAGMVNVIVRPKVYDRYRRILRGERLLLIEGLVQQEGDVTSLLAKRAAPLQP
jgi:DNA polymerase III alpha subunit